MAGALNKSNGCVNCLIGAQPLRGTGKLDENEPAAVTMKVRAALMTCAPAPSESASARGRTVIKKWFIAHPVTEFKTVTRKIGWWVIPAGALPRYRCSVMLSDRISMYDKTERLTRQN